LQTTVERPGRKPLVARFGGIPLRRQDTATITDVSANRGVTRQKELVTRLLAGRCELCRNTDGITVHHVRALVDLAAHRQAHPPWVAAMIRKRRKTLLVCRACHATIHVRAVDHEQITGEPSARKPARAVRAEGIRKGPAPQAPR